MKTNVDRVACFAHGGHIGLCPKHAGGLSRPADLRFSRGERGKPQVAGPHEALQGDPLHFNLSHTSGLLGGLLLR